MICLDSENHIHQLESEDIKRAKGAGIADLDTDSNYVAVCPLGAEHYIEKPTEIFDIGWAEWKPASEFDGFGVNPKMIKGAYLFGLYIRPEFRHQGHGTNLTRARLIDIVNRGYDFACCVIDQNNIASLMLHDKFEFKDYHQVHQNHQDNAFLYKSLNLKQGAQ